MGLVFGYNSLNFMDTGEQLLKELESDFGGVFGRLKEELASVRSGRPSVELVENIKVDIYGQEMTIKQLGSLSVVPPRMIHITVWDKSSVGAVLKAIEGAKIGMTASNDGNTIRASLPTLTDERREELSKLIKKMIEATRIQVRNKRDEVMKKMKAMGDEKVLNEDQIFKLKEKIQKVVDEWNGKIEQAMDLKLKEISE